MRRPRKPKLPRAPLPRQTGGAHGTVNQKAVKVLAARVRDAKRDQEDR